ncbi:hypothetical protein I203_101483 [Kwoniella mangroviensis CBS 8507]|uniref:uncharacterized protein n=1 Tax=Kwoniella mangroviensis CBS 8507 TaxID=1296122 RepID=UPI00080CFF41|nr:uncharacterized protein I203_05536 [Kwoniella mangroviensis CBS 8507]OCF65290.1 hypothetical protein I203_05536 [Kwoniella mangroviensis CBS 8507]
MSAIASASAKGDEGELITLLKRLATPSSSLVNLSRSEVSLLARSLVPSATRQSRSLAYLCLSKFCDSTSHHPDSTKDSSTDHIYSTFEPYLRSTFIPGVNQSVEESTEPESCLPLTCLLSSLFPLSPDATVNLLTTPLEDVGDGLSILLEVAELPSSLQVALAELLTAAAGTKSGRQMVRSRAMEWLKGAMDYQENNQELSVLCAVALSKMSRQEEEMVPTPSAQAPGQGDNNESRGITNEELGMDDEKLCRQLMGFMENTSSSTKPSSAILSTIEGLAVLSLKPKNKNILTSSTKFLESLISLSPTTSPKGGSLPVTPRGSMDLTVSLDQIDTGVCFGLSTILLNLTNPKVQLSAEDQQIAKLRAMALSANKSKLSSNTEDENEEKYESEEEVRKRTKLVLRSGVVGALNGLYRSESTKVKENLGRLCRNLVEDQNDRLSFIRDGGFKVLSNVSRDLLNLAIKRSNGDGEEIDVIPSFQALAKMIITTPPNLLFPPPHLTTSLNSLTPLYHLLIHPSSNSSQRFESLMALTNIASIDPSIANRTVAASINPLIKTSNSWKGSGSIKEDEVRMIVKVEELLLDENDLIRRASTQLICNLISCEKGYEYFSGENESSSDNSSSRVKSRLNILLILIGIDDLQTRLASGGALAIITESTNACRLILDLNVNEISPTSTSTTGSKSPWSRISKLLEPDSEEEEYDEDGEIIPVISSTPALPNLDMVHRGVIILFNLITYTVKLKENEQQTEMNRLEEAKVQDKLMQVLRLKGMSEDVLVPTVEALKLLKMAKK